MGWLFMFKCLMDVIFFMQKDSYERGRRGGGGGSNNYMIFDDDYRY